MAKRELKGIDGWLLVFMAGLVVTALVHLVIFGVGQMNTAWLVERYGPMPLSIVIANWIYNLSRIAIPLVIFWRMLRVHRWSSIRFALFGLWLLFVGVPLIDFAYAVWSVSGALDTASPLLISTLIRGGFFALCGTAYLLASSRVANTYPRADAPELLGEVFE